MPVSTLPLLFSTGSYAYLRDALLLLFPAEKGEVEVKAFPDGERYQRIITPLDARPAILIGGTLHDSDTLEVFDLACSLVKHGVSSLTLVIPYYGYSTMERSIKPGEVVTAKTRARLLSAIPAPPGGLQVLMVDLHVEGITHYFEGQVRPYHVYAKEQIQALARRFGGNDFVLACTDAGRAKWVESLANELGVPASFVFKRRIDGSHTSVSAVSAQVQDRVVVIYDDMIRTGSSLLNAAKAYRDAGAKKQFALCTHGVFPEDAFERIQASGLFEAVACTDSHPRARALVGKGLIVESIAPTLAQALRGHLAGW